MKFGNITIGKRLFVGFGKPEALGKGEKEIRGSAYVEGPLQVGRDTEYSKVEATVMIAEEYNSDAAIDAIPTSQDVEDGNNPKQSPTNLSLKVKGNVNIEGDSKTSYGLEVGGGRKEPLHVKGDIICDAISPSSIAERFEVADSKPKPFDMVHPSRGEGQRLRYACIEGPEVGVYYRGRVRNKNNVITLPAYWRDLVHTDSISVQLQPIGAHQDVIVKRWDDTYIYLQAQGGMPVDCFFHVYAERKDVNKLVTEYKGDSWADYPDPEYNDPKYGGQNIVTG
tara:strand:+ start:710 stop:1552 length:843 start_codon:yes stop_codon:yes gene_type:complete